MDKKNNSLGRIPNKPYLVWIMIFCAIIFLVMLPRGGALKVQNFDVRKLMSAANNDELVEISITNDPNGGKDWYSIVGKVKNPLFGREDAPADTPRTLDFKFEGRVTDDMYKQLSAPTSPWTVRENPAGSFWGNILTTYDGSSYDAQLIGYDDTPCFGEKRYTLTGGSFVPTSGPSVFAVVDGGGKIAGEGYDRELKKGDYWFMPHAARGKFTVSGTLTLIECLPSRQE